jgi:hypothetical protein
MPGYFSIERDLLTHSLWLDEPFSRGQAWIDLIGLANYRDGFIRVAGDRIEIKRGQCGWSELKLSERWRWSRNKVRRFLNELALDERLKREPNNRTTILTICNYDIYQNHGTPDGTPDDTTEGHQTIQQKDTIKKNNKNNKNNSQPDFFFEQFWEKFPRQRRGDRKETLTAWAKAITRATEQEVLNGLEAYIGSDEVARGFAKGAAAWLNASRWTVQYRAAGGTTGARPKTTNPNIMQMTEEERHAKGFA